MSRNLPPAMATLAASPSFPPVFFVQLDWPGGTVRLWGGYGDVTWGGHTWTGSGHLGAIGEVAESSDLSANSVALKLSGIPSAEIALALSNDYQGQPGTIYLGALNSDGTLVSDPHAIFAGFMDFTVIDDDGTTASITLHLAKDFASPRSQARRYTHEDQQIENPGDLFFDLLAGNSAKEFSWGRVTTYPAGAPGGGGDETGDGGYT